MAIYSCTIFHFYFKLTSYFFVQRMPVVVDLTQRRKCAQKCIVYFWSQSRVRSQCHKRSKCVMFSIATHFAWQNQQGLAHVRLKESAFVRRRRRRRRPTNQMRCHACNQTAEHCAISRARLANTPMATVTSTRCASAFRSQLLLDNL